MRQLLERESPLASLAAYAQEARRGHGRLVLVAGEAGVGKSALVEQFQCDLPDAGWSWGACDGLFTPRSLGPLFDLAERLGGELLDLCRSRAAREELFRALLRQISERGTLDVVVVEDVHWADEATLTCCASLAGGWRTPPFCSLPPTAARTWPRVTRCAPPLVSWSGSGRRGVSSWGTKQVPPARDSVPGGATCGDGHQVDILT
jgi:AAA ATPase domain